MRYGREQAAIDAWLERVTTLASSDYDLACEILECQKVLKGYGETQHHGTQSFGLLMGAVDTLAGRPDAAAVLAGLRSAALADEDGATLRAELARVGAPVLADAG